MVDVNDCVIKLINRAAHAHFPSEAMQLGQAAANVANAAVNLHSAGLLHPTKNFSVEMLERLLKEAKTSPDQKVEVIF